MNSSRPYLIRAIYEWLVDNGVTPHMLVDTEIADVMVPEEFVQEGKIILNLSPMAVQHLVLGDGEITFSAKFGGRAMNVYCPVNSVLAIYAKENGQGMAFDDHDGAFDPDPDPTDPTDPTDPKGPKGSSGPRAVPKSDGANGGTSNGKSERPNLRVIK